MTVGADFAVQPGDFPARRLTLWERLLRTLWLAALLLPFGARVPLHHPGWFGVLFLLLTLLAWPIFQAARARGQVLWLGFIGSTILLAESWRLGGTVPALALALYVAISLATLASLEWSETGGQWRTEGRRGPGTASVIAAVLAGGLVFGPMAAAGAASVSLGVGLPGAASWYRLSGGRGLGGILGLPPNLAPSAGSLGRISMARSWDLPDTTVMTIAGAPGPAYWSLATYDDFDGRNWLGSGEVPQLPTAGASTLLPPELAGTDTTQWTVTVHRLTNDTNGPLIYTGTPESVTVAGAAVQVQVQPQLRTLWATGAAIYTLRLAVPQVDPRLLQAAGFVSPPPELSRDLAVPADTSRQVAELARSIAGDASGPWQAAQRVADYLRTNAKYTTAFSVPDGSVVNGFLLDTKSGYCDQFSSSFIVMMRELGIPARWVMGYRVAGDAGQAGSAATGTGGGQAGTPQEYRVNARDAHSWAEVYVAPYGWVPVDPTPGGDVLGSYVTPTPAPAPNPPGTGNPAPPSPPTPTPGVSPTPAGGGNAGGPSVPATQGMLPALAALVIAAALLGTVTRWRRRASSARLSGKRAERLWRAMSALANRQEPSRSMTNITPRELFGLLPAESRPAVLPAMRLLEQVWYGEAALPPAEVMAAEARLKAEISRAHL